MQTPSFSIGGIPTPFAAAWVQLKAHLVVPSALPGAGTGWLAGLLRVGQALERPRCSTGPVGHIGSRDVSLTQSRVGAWGRSAGGLHRWRGGGGAILSSSMVDWRSSSGARTSQACLPITSTCGLVSRKMPGSRKADRATLLRWYGRCLSSIAGPRCRPTCATDQKSAKPDYASLGAFVPCEREPSHLRTTSSVSRSTLACTLSHVGVAPGRGTNTKS